MKKNIITPLLFITLFSFILLYQACDDTLGPDLDNIIIPSSNVSYSQYIQPVFNAKCATAGCHDDQTQRGGLSLTTHTNATADFLVVAPGDTINSKLVWVIKGEANHPTLPRYLTRNQIQGIVTWIAEGAQNN